MTVFIPKTNSKGQTPDEHYSHVQMARRAPPLIPEEDTQPPLPEPGPPALNENWDPPDFISDDTTYVPPTNLNEPKKRYVYKLFTASTAYPNYFGNPQGQDTGITPYGRFGYRINRLTPQQPDYLDEMNIPYIYDPGYSTAQTWIQIFVTAENNSNPNVAKWQTAYDTLAGEIIGSPTARPNGGNLTPGGWTITGPKLAQGFSGDRDFRTTAIPLQIDRNQMTPGLNIITIRIRAGLTSSIQFHAYTTWFPQQLTFKEFRPDTSQTSVNTWYRLADSDQTGWDLRYSPTNIINPIDLYEQSDDKDNLHAYVQPNTGPAQNHQVSFGLAVTDYPWPATVSTLGVGYIQLLNPDGTNTPATNGPTRWNGRSDYLSRGPIYPDGNTSQYRSQRVSGSGLIWTPIHCITYLNHPGDRNLQNMGFATYPGRSWAHGYGSKNLKSFPGDGTGLPIALWDDTQKLWV